MNIHDIIKFINDYNSTSQGQVKKNEKINEFIATYKAYSNTNALTLEGKADLLFLLTLLFKPNSVVDLLQETNKDVLNLFKTKSQQYAERIKSFSEENKPLLTETIKADSNDNSDGFNQSIYEEILPLTQLAYLLENNGAPEEHAYKLTVMLGSKEASLKYLKDAYPKNLHDACLFSLPSSSHKWNIEAWRTLATKQSNLAKNQKFQTLLAEAGRIEEKMLNVEWLKARKEFIEKKVTPENNVNNLDRLKTELKELNELIALKTNTKHSAPSSTEILYVHKSRELQPSFTKKATLFLKGTSVETLNEVYATLLYEGAEKDPEAAILFKKYGISQEGFDLYLTLSPTGGANIPAVTIKCEELSQEYKGYYLKKLAPTDPRAAVLGKMTGCCQSLGWAGQDCVIHGITSPNGGFYVICKGDADNPTANDEVIAQTWAWRSQDDALVYDSIEYPLSLSMKLELICDFFTLLAHKLVTEKNIPKVMVGGDGNTPDTIGWPTNIKERFKDYGGYGDSQITQRIVAVKDNPIYYYARVKLNNKIPKNGFWKAIITNNLKIIKIEQLKEWIESCIVLHKQHLLKDALSILPSNLQPQFKKLRKSSEEMYIACLSEPLVLEKIIELAREGASLEMPIDEDGNTVFMQACYSNNQKACNLLLENGADINAINKDDDTALMLAVKAGNVEIVKLLIQTPGINLKIADEFGDSVLLVAAKACKWEIVKLLIQTPGIDLKIKSEFGYTLLMVAAKSGNVEIVKLLIQTPGIDLKEKNEFGDTVLMVAAKTSKWEIVKLLIQTPGIDLQEKDRLGNTILMLAKKILGEGEIVKILNNAMQSQQINITL